MIRKLAVSSEFFRLYRSKTKRRDDGPEMPDHAARPRACRIKLSGLVRKFIFETPNLRWLYQSPGEAQPPKTAFVE
jgi:hypothetical protein